MYIASILLLLIPLSVRTHDEREPAKWLKKLSTATRQTSFNVDLAVDIRLLWAGQKTTIKMNGALTYVDAKRLKMKVAAKMTKAHITLTSEILMVGDGHQLWMEQKLAEEEPIVAKLAISRQEQMSGLDPFNWTPERMFELIADHLDLKFQRREDGKVRLSATVSKANGTRLALGDPNDMDLTNSTMVLEMDEQSAYPAVITTQIGETLSLKVEASALRYPKPGETVKLCSYTPAKGVVVQDQTTTKQQNRP